jgi:hypothetical protein
MPLTITETLDPNDVTDMIALATAFEGKQAYSYSWGWVTQPQGLAISPVDERNIQIATEDALGGVKSGLVRVTATDALGQTDTDDLTVNITVPMLSIALDSASIIEEMLSSATSAATVTASATEGVAPYTYDFAWVERSDTVIDIEVLDADTVAVATVSAPDGDYTGTIRVTVTDSLGQTDTADITVEITVEAPAELPDIYLTSANEAGWSSLMGLPVADYDPANDVILMFDGFMGFFSSNMIYDHDGSLPALGNRTSTVKNFGASGSTFGNRQPENDLAVYGYCALGIGTLGSLVDQVGTGFTGGFDNGVSHSCNTYVARRVYRGTDAARRVIGNHNTPLTGGPFTTVTVPGITVPNDDSLVVMCCIQYAGLGYWYENGVVDDGWTRPAGQQWHRFIQWKRFPAGATGNLNFTRLFNGAEYSCWKRLCFLVCLDSVVA